MKFTYEQFKTLAEFETPFRTAVNSNWARRPSTSGLQLIHTIFTSVTGDTRRLNTGCQNCILNLLRDCGRLYFKDKEERTAIEAEEMQREQEREFKDDGIIPKTPQNGRKNETKSEKQENPRPKKVNANKRTKTTKSGKDGNEAN